MLKEFKEFILKGNILDLAIGVVIGSAFTTIVNKIVEGVITPLIGLVISLVTRGKDLNEATSVLDWTPVKGVTFAFGDVVSATITFLITGLVLFLIVKASNKAKSNFEKPEESPVSAPTTEDYLKEIRDILEKK